MRVEHADCSRGGYDRQRKHVGSGSPSWAAALGPGVTVIGPVSASPGHSSPQAVVTGVAAAEDSGSYRSLCTSYERSLQSDCNSQVSAEASASPSAVASQIGTIKNLTVGYTASAVTRRWWGDGHLLRFR
jgi:hypothetical protein